MNDWMRWGIGITAGVLFSLFIVPTEVPSVEPSLEAGHYNYTTTLLGSFFAMSVFFTIPITWVSSRSYPVTRMSDSGNDPRFLNASTKRKNIGFSLLVLFGIAVLIYSGVSSSTDNEAIMIALDRFLMGPACFLATVGVYYCGTLQCAYCSRLNVPKESYCVACDCHLHIHKPHRK